MATTPYRNLQKRAKELGLPANKAASVLQAMVNSAEISAGDCPDQATTSPPRHDDSEVHQAFERARTQRQRGITGMVAKPPAAGEGGSKEGADKTPAVPLAPFMHKPGAGVVSVFIMVAAGAVQWLEASSADDLGFNAATVAAIGTPAPDSGLSVEAFAVIRSVLALITLVVWIGAMTDPVPMQVRLIFWKDSAIAGPAEYTFEHSNRLVTFTVQSWTLLTVYFLGAAACSAAVAYGPAPGVAAQPWSDNVAVVLLVLYEMNVTLALLVTVIVTFVLIPGRLQKGESVDVFWTWRSLMMHNANLLFIVTDMLLNQTAMQWSHIPFPVLYGIVYGVFGWWWLWRTGACFYPFLDPTLPPQTSVPVHLGIIVLMVGFFAIGVGVDTSTAGISFGMKATAVYTGAFLVTWTGVLTGGQPQPVKLKPQ